MGFRRPTVGCCLLPGWLAGGSTTIRTACCRAAGTARQPPHRSLSECVGGVRGNELPLGVAAVAWLYMTPAGANRRCSMHRCHQPSSPPQTTAMSRPRGGGVVNDNLESKNRVGGNSAKPHPSSVATSGPRVRRNPSDARVAHVSFLGRTTLPFRSSYLRTARNSTSSPEKENRQNKNKFSRERVRVLHSVEGRKKKEGVGRWKVERRKRKIARIAVHRTTFSTTPRRLSSIRMTTTQSSQTIT